MGSSMAEAVLDRRTALIKQATELAGKGVAESRDLTVEEQTAFDGMIAEAQKLAERAQAIHEGEQRAADLDASFRRVNGGAPVESRDAGQFDQWLRLKYRADGPPEYDLKPLRPGSEMRALARVKAGAESRAMSATGGISSDSVYDQLFEFALQGSQLLRAGVTFINTSDGNTLPLPVAGPHAATSDTATAANAALATSDATLATVSNTVQKFDYLTLVPTELQQDVVFDLSGYLSRSAGRELGRRIAKQANIAYIAGYTVNGVTGPVGTTVSLGAQGTAGQGTDLLNLLYHSVLPEYRVQACGWTLTDGMAAIIRNLKATTGQPIWQLDGYAQAGQAEGAILGKPVYIDPFLPAAAANAKTIYFGDWSSLVVRVAGGVRFERSNDYAFGNDQVAYRAIVRTGTSVTDANAVKFFAQSAT